MRSYSTQNLTSNWTNSLLDGIAGSPTLCLLGLGLLSMWTAINLWNFGVDCYVARYGAETEVPVLFAHSHNDSYTVRKTVFEYQGIGQPDKYRLPFGIDTFHFGGAGRAAALVYWGNRNYQRDGGYGTLKICYLPHSPGTFVAKQDMRRFYGQPFFACLSICGMFWLGKNFCRHYDRSATRTY